MSVFKSNLDNINWNAHDDDGNTMLHYVTIMNKYSACACEIIRHVKENHTNLVNKGNSRGVVPLASVLHDGFICKNTKEANSSIIRGLIDAGANFCVKSTDSATYLWKGLDDQLFCVSNEDSNTILVAPKVITKINGDNYKICCSLKEPPECQLYLTTNIANLPKNLLERVLKFPCIQIHKSFFTNNYCNFTSTMQDGTLCMHYIVEYGSEELVEFMFDRGLDSLMVGTNVNKNTNFSLLDNSRNSILHTAIRKRITANAVVIIKRCSGKTLNVMLDTQNSSKEFPLDLVLKNKLFTLIASINHHRPDTFCKTDSDGSSWFHRAVQDKSEELLKVLTEQENLAGYIDSENTNQYTPLMLCVREKFVEGFKILKGTKKCHIDVHDTEGYTLLHLAIMYYEKEILSELLQAILSDTKSRQIIDKKSKIPTTTSPNYPGLTPLLLSLKCKQFTAARLLIQNGASINMLDCEGRTFNSYLIERCHDKQELDNFFAITVISEHIHNDVSALSLSIQYTNVVFFNLLLPKCNLDMIAYQDDSNTVLNLILSHVKYTSFLEPLISRLEVLFQDESQRAKLSETIDKQNKKGEKPLNISIITKNSELVGKLLDLGCNVSKDILHLATSHGDLQMVTCILNRIPNNQLVNKMLSAYIKDQTPLHIAYIHRKTRHFREISVIEHRSHKQGK